MVWSEMHVWSVFYRTGRAAGWRLQISCYRDNSYILFQVLTNTVFSILYSEGGVTRSSAGAKRGEQGPELGKLFTKVYT